MSITIDEYLDHNHWDDLIAKGIAFSQSSSAGKQKISDLSQVKSPAEKSSGLFFNDTPPDLKDWKGYHPHYTLPPAVEYCATKVKANIETCNPIEPRYKSVVISTPTAVVPVAGAFSRFVPINSTPKENVKLVPIKNPYNKKPASKAIQHLHIPMGIQSQKRTTTTKSVRIKPKNQMKR